MHQHTIVATTPNTQNHSKPITALIMQPDQICTDTSLMLFTHGWGANRFQHEDKMRWATDRFNVISVSVEYRHSGYECDPLHGNGACVPYDSSLWQVI